MVATDKNRIEDLLLDFFVNKKWSMVRHVGLIVVAAVGMYPPQYITVDYFQNAGEANPTAVLSNYRITLFLLFIEALVMLYINLYILVPRLLFRNKFLLYLLSCVALVASTLLLELLIPMQIKKYLPSNFILTSFTFKSVIESTTMGFVFLIATAGYKVFKKWLQDTRQMAAIKEAGLKEELRNLKNQINPHFLFNTLNNLNTLITTDPQKASTVVLGLSDVLRFYLYEADKDKILLQKDVNILQQVLDLEKIRRDDFEYHLIVYSSISGVLVPPFIFIIFLENAIKHSLNNNAASTVNVGLTIDDGHLTFTCENSKPATCKPATNYGGLGLLNVQRRLELLYGENYTLKIHDEGSRYAVFLKIPL